MDYWTRLILAAIIGGGLGWAISRYIAGDMFGLIFIGVAIALAVETGLRTAKNIKPPANPVLDKIP